LLLLRSCKDASLREQAMEGLALVGYVDPVKARGIRILTLDGGGTRYLINSCFLQNTSKTKMCVFCILLQYSLTMQILATSIS
jgi:hypothetical protein